MISREFAVWLEGVGLGTIIGAVTLPSDIAVWCGALLFFAMTFRNLYTERREE